MKIRIVTLCTLAGLLLSGCGRNAEHPYELSAQRIKEATEYLCNEIGDRPASTEKSVMACDWLEEQMLELGFSPENGTLERQPFFDLFDQPSENLIGICNPNSDGPIFCIMAHYDTVEGTPGARDNTSSVATLLELARYLGTEREDLDAQVRFLFLGSEENGYHGASAYTKRLTQEETARHLAAYNMENSAAHPGGRAVLITGTQGGRRENGYLEGNFLEAAENLASQSFSWAYRHYYGGETLLVHWGGSDHLIFHNYGIDAANTAWKVADESGIPTRHPEYHEPTDTPEGLDFDGAVITGCCILGAIFHVMEGP